jgi:hypothetical protein
VASEDPKCNLWTVNAVNDGRVTLLVNGEVVILHAGDQEVFSVDLLFAGIQPGKPVEMTKPQAIHLAQLILRVLGPP